MSVLRATSGMRCRSRTTPLAQGDLSASAFGAIVAPTTGLELAVFAMPAGEAQVGAEVALPDRTGIVALATPFLSLHDPLVQEPFQFVVVGWDGRVIFHAARGPIRGERFFDDQVLLGGASLQRAAWLGGSEIADYRYRERMHRMLARPLPELGATLVAYYDKTAVDSIAAQTFATAAVFAVVIVASVMIGAGLSCRIFFRP